MSTANTREIVRLDGLSIEKLSDNIYLVREHDAGGSYGSAWRSSMVLVVYDDECEIMSMSSAVRESTRKQLIEHFSAVGVKYIIFDRIKNGRMIKMRIKV